MSSLSPKDRVSLCSFTFSDGRRCCTPRFANHPHFCPYHAEKEARAHAADTLGKDLAYFFSGDYLSACDLSTALGRLIPAVIRGDVKPKTAHTVAYLMQTLLQAIHVSQHEYGEAFGGNAWRQSIRNSVNANHDYLDPEPEPRESPQPQPVEPPLNCHSERSEDRFLSARFLRGESAFSKSQADPPQQAPSPHTPLPPTSTEFVQQVLAGQNSSRPLRASQILSRQPGSATANSASQPAETPVNCHSAFRDVVGERSAPSALRTNLRSEGSHPIPATQPAPSAVPTPQPACPEQGRRVNPREPDRSAPWLDFSDTSRIRPDSKLL